MCRCSDARDFLAPSDGDDGNSGNKKKASKRKEGERRRRKGEERKREEVFGKGLIFEAIWREMTCKIRE